MLRAHDARPLPAARSVEETSNAMAFDGLQYQGETLKVRRPHDYNPAAAKLLGPTDPSSKINLALLGVVNTLVEDGPNKVFVGGLPGFLSEEQVRRRAAGRCFCKGPHGGAGAMP